MPRDGQDLNAIESMSKLMGRICPALHKAPITRKPGLPKVEDVTFVALYLDKRTPPNESRLTLHPEGMALSVESRDCIPAGNYQFHIYDTTFEAVAALRALEAVGFMDTVERFELPAGEGVIMIRCGDDPGPVPTGAMLQHGAELSETVHSFEGQGGQVCINLIDNRLDLTAETGGFSRTRQAFLSISFPRGDVCRILHDDKARHSDTHKRGHLLARMVAASCRTPSALRFCQRSLETITGALVPVSSISVDHVMDQLEDMLEGLEEDILPPRQEDMHDLVVSQARSVGPDPQDLARDVAWAALHKNMTRRA